MKTFGYGKHVTYQVLMEMGSDKLHHCQNLRMDRDVPNHNPLWGVTSTLNISLMLSVNVLPVVEYRLMLQVTPNICQHTYFFHFELLQHWMCNQLSRTTIVDIS